MARLVHDAADAVNNIKKYTTFLEKNVDLQKRASTHRAWYATKSGGVWLFGPSKFVGYHWQSSDEYVAESDQHDGRETERAIQQFSQEVGPHTALGQTLRRELAKFLADYGKKPSAGTRIRVFDGIELESIDASENEHLVALLQQVANKLPSCDRQAVRAGIRL